MRKLLIFLIVKIFMIMARQTMVHVILWLTGHIRISYRYLENRKVQGTSMNKCSKTEYTRFREKLTAYISTDDWPILVISWIRLRFLDFDSNVFGIEFHLIRSESLYFHSYWYVLDVRSNKPPEQFRISNQKYMGWHSFACEYSNVGYTHRNYVDVLPILCTMRSYLV
jgi:hypothetical protein